MRYTLFSLAATAGLVLLSLVVHAEPRELYLENLSQPGSLKLTAKDSVNCELQQQSSPLSEEHGTYINKPAKLKPRLCLSTSGPSFSATLGPMENGPLHIGVIQSQQSGRYGVSLSVNNDSATVRAGIPFRLQKPDQTGKNWKI